MASITKVKEQKLDRRVIIPLLIMAIVEYEVFTFSSTTVAAARQDAWISILIGAVIGSFFVYIFVKLASRFPEMSFFQYLKVVWGKYIGFAISIIYIIFWLTFLSSIFYEIILANKLLFLEQTPAIIPLIILAGVLIWLVLSGIHSIIRFFIILFPFLVIPLLVLIILFIPAIKIDNFLPILGEGLIPVLKGSFYFLGAYQGPEVLLFVAPLFMKLKKATKPALVAFNTTVFFGWSNTVAAIGVLGVITLKQTLLPGISVVNIIEFPGFPVERFGLLLTLPWLIAIFTTLTIYLYLLCSNTVELFSISKKKNLAMIALILIPVTAAYFLPNEIWHEKLRLYLTIATIPIVYILPMLTYFLAVLRRKGKGRHI